MTSEISRRNLFLGAGGLAAAPLIQGTSTTSKWPPLAGPDTPQICLGSPGHSNEAALRRLVQIGVTQVLMGGPAIPWQVADLRGLRERFQANGLQLTNLMIGGFPDAIYGRPGRDEEIDKVLQSIRAAGKAGLPVVEYNFYAHRLVEGYYEEPGRGGAGLTAYDYARSKDLPPLEEVGIHTAEALWDNITYFLKAVVPAAEEAGVRLALHPNDPPVPIARGSAQILATLADWKRLIEIVPSPANGITYDCGVTCEIGEDPVSVCRYFGERDRINHVHYRNVRVRRPYLDYTEVFLDEGEVDLFGVMKELVRLKYSRALYPEHPRALDYDRAQPGFKVYYPGGGGYAGLVYNVAYTKAMLQAVLSC